MRPTEAAGLIMWIPAGALLTIMGIALFAAWLGEADRRSQRSALDSNRVIHR